MKFCQCETDVKINAYIITNYQKKKKKELKMFCRDEWKKSMRKNISR